MDFSDKKTLALIERLTASADHLAASLRLQEGVTDDLRTALAAERARSAALGSELAATSAWIDTNNLSS